MNQHICLLVCFAVVHIPSIAGAQTIAQSFTELSGRLKPGDSVDVTEASRQTKGKFIEVSPTSLALSINGRRQDFNITMVNRVERERTAMKKGALLGLLAGAGAAVFCGINESHCGLGNDCEGGACIAGAALAGTGLAVGTGVTAGVVIGVRIKHRDTMFAASGRPASRTLSLAPFVDRRPRTTLIRAVRAACHCGRTRCSAWSVCCSMVFTGTGCIPPHRLAWSNASVSVRSVLLRRPDGRTY